MITTVLPVWQEFHQHHIEKYATVIMHMDNRVGRNSLMSLHDMKLLHDGLFSHIFVNFKIKIIYIFRCACTQTHLYPSSICIFFFLRENSCQIFSRKAHLVMCLHLPSSCFHNPGSISQDLMLWKPKQSLQWMFQKSAVPQSTSFGPWTQGHL